jgi:hypothetical protein
MTIATSVTLSFDTSRGDASGSANPATRCMIDSSLSAKGRVDAARSWSRRSFVPATSSRAFVILRMFWTPRARRLSSRTPFI